MKPIYTMLIFIVASVTTTAQNIGIGTTTPNSSAILELKASDRGLLIPRTSTASRTAIVNPAKGLMIYDSTSSSFWFHNGIVWTQIGASANGWFLTGNIGTNPANDFIGTTDAKSLVFKVNNIKAGFIDHSSASNLALGYQSLFSNTIGTKNTAIGYRSLSNNTNGYQNTAIGDSALFSNIDGFNNTAAGSFALNENISGQQNTAIGYSALIHNNNGNLNTALGTGAMYQNSTGYNNVANGAYAMFNNTTGTSNSANGMYALYLNTAGHQNTASGYAALYSNQGNYNSAYGAAVLNNNSTGTWNSATGAYSMYYNTTGGYNTAVGGYALENNSSGNNNVAHGYRALNYNITGYSNVAVGALALVSNESGYNLVAIGDSALFNNSTGLRNTAVGSKALYSNTTGFYNTAIGHRALFYTTGQRNTAIGDGALNFNIVGSYNTALGAGADVRFIDLSNSTVIGSDAVVDASNKVHLGNTSVTSIGGQVGWTTFSDGRYKKNIKEDVKGLSFIKSLRPVTYTVDINGLNEYYDKGRKHDSNYEMVKKDMQASSDEAATIVFNGFIAQEVELTAQSIGYKFNGVDKPKTKDGLYGLRYAEFVVPLVKAVQEQQQMIEDLKIQITTQEKINATLIARLTALESTLTLKK